MVKLSDDEIGARAARVLASEGRAEPPAHLAARVSAAAFASTGARANAAPGFFDEWRAGIAQLVKPAAGLACAAAVVLVAVAWTRESAESAETGEVTTADVRALGVSEPSFALLAGSDG
jgi:hypothetical protein